MFTDELDRPGRGAFALVIDDEHLPHLDIRHLAKLQSPWKAQVPAAKAGPSILAITELELKSGQTVSSSTAPAVPKIFSVTEARLLAEGLRSPLAQALTPRP